MAKTSLTMPQVGDEAPNFEATTGTGERVTLEGFRGRPVVLYFYPKDDTPGCTVEAGEFQALLPEFRKADAEVLGVSPDDGPSHCKFADKYGLEFPLLADTSHELAEKYGAWVEKNMYGRKYWGVQRSTFLIDREGRIARVWPKVRPAGHAEEVLEAVKAL